MALAETTSSAFCTLIEEAAKERNPERLEEIIAEVGKLLRVLECSVADVTDGDEWLH